MAGKATEWALAYQICSVATQTPVDKYAPPEDDGPDDTTEPGDDQMTKPAETAASTLPAASVVIIRNGMPQGFKAGGKVGGQSSGNSDLRNPGGLEVFMLERHQGSGQTFAGAFVFPGGKVDAEDAAPGWNALLAATPPAIPERAFWIAAVRETFEEAGLLIARRQGSTSLIGAADAKRLVAAERGQPRKGQSARFAAMIAHEKLLLATDHMIHFGHWITPTWQPKRFDTHFFLSPAPLEQSENFDRGESAEGVWITPIEALAQADAGQRTLVAVTRCTLELLATWASVEEAVAAARKRKIITVQPYMAETSNGRVLRIPVEAGYVRSELPVPAVQKK